MRVTFLVIGKIMRYWIGRWFYRLEKGANKRKPKMWEVLWDIYGKSQASEGCIFWEWLKSGKVVKSKYGNRPTGSID